ncbi:hypothetical protein HMPREF1545_00735 [Oscillibacter sp. KLE 1728]|nr:hypothetical protein HMPREF1545_00735 [Oscillibacter sp. KLE 1728]ERK68453.1 hypothetical protein HMPREF1546_00079 [Oscillibacter sp. KLE 1745]
MPGERLNVKPYGMIFLLLQFQMKDEQNLIEIANIFLALLSHIKTKTVNWK